MWISSSSSVGVGARITWRTRPQSFACVSAVDQGYTVDFCNGFCATSVAIELTAATETTSKASGSVFMADRVRQLAVLR